MALGSADHGIYLYAPTEEYEVRINTYHLCDETIIHAYLSSLASPCSTIELCYGC